VRASPRLIFNEGSAPQHLITTKVSRIDQGKWRIKGATTPKMQQYWWLILFSAAILFIVGVII
jgi:hypothetical protein